MENRIGAAGGFGYATVHRIVDVADQCGATRILDHLHPVPGIVGVLLAGLVGGHVAVSVIGRRRRPTDTGDLVLLVGRAGLGRTVGRDRVPVAHGIVVPTLGPCTAVAVRRAELVQAVVGVGLAVGTVDGVALGRTVAIAVVGQRMRVAVVVGSHQRLASGIDHHGFLFTGGTGPGAGSGH